MMAMMQVIIRPEKEDEVILAFENSGFSPLTRLQISGRGRQRGIQVEPVDYEEFRKIWLMIVVDASERDRVVDAINITACIGNLDDGKNFVSALQEARSVLKGSV